MNGRMLTRRKTQEAKEIEPKIPDSASWSGNGAVAHIVASEHKLGFAKEFYIMTKRINGKEYHCTMSE